MKTSNGKSNGKLVAGLAAGAVVGTALGILVAPNPGRQTRSKVRDKSRQTFGLLRDSYKKQKVSNRVESDVNGVLESSF